MKRKAAVVLIIFILLILLIIFIITKTSAGTGTGTSAGTGKTETSPGAGTGSTSEADSIGSSIGKTVDSLKEIFGMPSSNADESLANITFNDTTWVNGYNLNDRIWVIANAIAHAEGADIENSVADRLNNPGDITDGRETYGIGFIDSIDNSQLTQFPNKRIGWQWLYDKIKRIATDTSGMGLDSNSTWTQISQKWATNWKPWLSIVTTNLNVDQNTTIGQYINGETGYWPS